MEVVHFKVGALLTVKGSRLEAAFADPGAGSTNGVVAGFAPLQAIHRLLLGGTFISSWIFVKT